MKTFDEVMAEVQRLAAADACDDLIRYTGEQLAVANDRLSAAAAGGKDAARCCSELLTLALIHTQFIGQREMLSETFATLDMALLTVLRSRVEPPRIGFVYCSAVQHTFLSCMLTLNELYGGGDAFAVEHYEAMCRELAPLAVATGELFTAMPDCPYMVRKLHELICADVADIEEFQGEARPEDAIDVLADCAARLHAIGAF